MSRTAQPILTDTVAMEAYIKLRVRRAVRRENRACRMIAVDKCWAATQVADRRWARIQHQTAKDIAEAIERRHAK